MEEVRVLIGNMLIVMGSTMIIMSAGAMCWEWFDNNQKLSLYDIDNRIRFLERRAIFSKEIEAPTEAPTEAPIEAPTEAPTEAPIEAPIEAPTEAPTEAAPEEALAVADIVEDTL